MGPAGKLAELLTKSNEEYVLHKKEGKNVFYDRSDQGALQVYYALLEKEHPGQNEIKLDWGGNLWLTLVQVEMSELDFRENLLRPIYIPLQARPCFLHGAGSSAEMIKSIAQVRRIFTAFF